ncbi:7-carboxy-7-deazaguanine synthase QueE [Bacillus horti]|uniref:7-carboxy-7-deazaguanine synthase n=1 Tax=Caldalkalibacillus horti TaxID=77523 RepID=A0ABT9VX34_9BACI|nr:radical SAM protein [Bacillus horti]MDQ0165455.1 7-carboxy-7-deazaguanine synthase [Bacillus horti]
MFTQVLPDLLWNNKTYTQEQVRNWKVPMVEIFETVEGEGMKAGFPTVFVRVFHCNLRCTWCDTPYSYAPAEPEYEASIAELVADVQKYPSQSICFTGGEPLIHREKSAGIIHSLSYLDHIEDIHIETNGAIPIETFAKSRAADAKWKQKVRFVMDYKLPDSGEMDKMVYENFKWLQKQDEIKFVIGTDQDFEVALEVLDKYHEEGQVLMSPVWETMPPHKLVEKVLERKLSHVKVSLQMHKIIWDPNQRGV